MTAQTGNQWQQDPLVHRRSDAAKQVASAIAFAIAAVVAHAGAMGVISAASWAAGSAPAVAPKPERVAVAIVEPELPPAAEPEPLPKPAAQPEPIIKAPAPKPKRAPRPRPKLRVTEAPPPPAPINPSKPLPEPAPPVRRTIGLNLESTVEGGTGPTFAAGNSRMGQTGRVAADPSKVDRRRAGRGAPSMRPTPAPAGANRVAAHIPGTKTKLVRPKRLARVSPHYPPVLRARNIEGTVVVRVRINARGHVTKVDVVAAAKHPAFNDAARTAARKERFRPATKNGTAIAFFITFSYRFRLNDS